MLRKSCFALAVTSIATISGFADAQAGGYAFAPNSPTTIDWTGVYIGGHGGYSWSGLDSAYDFGNASNFLYGIGLQKGFSEDVKGWMGGGHVGAQWQYGKWVMGVEGSYDKMDLDGSSKSDFAASFVLPGGTCPGGLAVGGCVVGTQALKTQIDDLWTVTGRLGYTWDRWLAYVKGGFARAEVSAQSDINANIFGCLGACAPLATVGFSGSSKEDHNGWTAGVGTEYMLRKNITLGLEYDYVKLESKDHTVDGVTALDFGRLVGGGDFGTKHGLDIDPDAIYSVSARLSFLFGPEEQHVAPLK